MSERLSSCCSQLNRMAEAVPEHLNVSHQQRKKNASIDFLNTQSITQSAMKCEPSLDSSISLITVVVRGKLR